MFRVKTDVVGSVLSSVQRRRTGVRRPTMVSRRSRNNSSRSAVGCFSEALSTSRVIGSISLHHWSGGSTDNGVASDHTSKVGAKSMRSMFLCVSLTSLATSGIIFSAMPLRVSRATIVRVR